jgi:hypothetical protein
MKKITFILFALITGTSFAQSADASATASTTIVSPIAIVVGDNLEFGQLASPAAITAITVGATGRTAVTGITLPGGTAAQPATFVVTAGTFNFGIVYEATSLILSTGTNGADMALVIGSETGATASGDQTITVGGVLTVGANQPAGAYAGTAKVTVAYQ